jgi:hypothetical protein
MTGPLRGLPSGTVVQSSSFHLQIADFLYVNNNVVKELCSKSKALSQA